MQIAQLVIFVILAYLIVKINVRLDFIVYQVLIKMLRLGLNALLVIIVNPVLYFQPHVLMACTRLSVQLVKKNAKGA